MNTTTLTVNHDAHSYRIGEILTVSGSDNISGCFVITGRNNAFTLTVRELVWWELVLMDIHKLFTTNWIKLFWEFLG